MCGITGFINSKAGSNSQMESVIVRMNNALTSRGPDNSGIWLDHNRGVALAHRRLSVIDLSENASQPMESHSGRYIITFNGEIYNYRELRNELSSVKHINWKSTSDTEIVLGAIERWGLSDALKKFVGMFAIAIWDKKERILYLARDRFGKKPLYWGQFKGLFLFGSELKALREHNGWVPKINRKALAAFMQYNYIPSPLSIYENIYKLPPGSILTYTENKAPEIKQYWKAEDVIKNGREGRVYKSENDILIETESILEEVVNCRMISDVPIGVFLSGGIDSSIVTALMQKNSSIPAKSFSIGFHDNNYDEAIHAKAVASHLGTDHTDFYITPNDALKVIPELPNIYDEPFSDSSQLPTYLVSKLTRQYVTVALTGDGGDELFAGYNRYLYAQNVMPRMNALPAMLQNVLKKIIYVLPQNKWESLIQLLSLKHGIPNIGDKLYKIARIIGEDDITAYQKLVSHWSSDEAIVLSCGGGNNDLNISKLADSLNGVELMQLIDIQNYLPDDILTKVDRASMAVSLEARAPLLDHRILEYTSRLPLNMKIRHGKGKWLLRNILYKYVPQEIIERPKAGFAIPLGTWLQGPLRDWAEDLLAENKIRQQGYLDPLPIKKKWEEHVSGKANWQYHLWNVLMFQAWYERWM